jgi:TRAP-type C4-dicarboxylate transport system permease small subunit
MDKLHLFENKICVTLLVIAGFTLAFMLVFTVLNVILRAFGHPIVGDVEIMCFLGAVVISFSLPYTSMRKGHVLVDLLLEKISKRSSGTLQVVTRVVSIALFAWIGWNFCIMSLDLVRSGEVTPVFRLPYYPISFGVAFSCLVQCFVLILQVSEITGDRHE